MPSCRTFFRWLADPRYEGFRQNYVRAHEHGCEPMAEEMLAIADEISRDTIIDEEGNEKPNTEWINRSRLRIDTRKWLLSKRAPKKYGDKQQVEHSGSIEMGLAERMRKADERLRASRGDDIAPQ